MNLKTILAIMAGLSILSLGFACFKQRDERLKERAVASHKIRQDSILVSSLLEDLAKVESKVDTIIKAGKTIRLPVLDTVFLPGSVDTILVHKDSLSKLVTNCKKLAIAFDSLSVACIMERGIHNEVEAALGRQIDNLKLQPNKKSDTFRTFSLGALTGVAITAISIAVIK